MTPSETNRAIDAVWRIESPRLIAGLTRMVRDVGLAEELAQDALVVALGRWPAKGVPANPGAWPMATAKHRAIDALRRAKRLELRHEELGRELEARQDATAPDTAPGIKYPRPAKVGMVGDDHFAATQPSPGMWHTRRASQTHLVRVRRLHGHRPLTPPMETPEHTGACWLPSTITPCSAEALTRWVAPGNGGPRRAWSPPGATPSTVRAASSGRPEAGMEPGSSPRHVHVSAHAPRRLPA